MLPISALARSPFFWVAVSCLVLSVSLSESQVTPSSVQLRNSNNIVMATSGFPASTDVGLVVIQRDIASVTCVSGCSGGPAGGNATEVRATLATSSSQIGYLATSTNQIGSVLQGTNPWTVNGAVSATITNNPSVLATVGNSGFNATITNTLSVNATIGNTSLPVTQSGNWFEQATLATSSSQIGFLASSTNLIGVATASLATGTNRIGAVLQSGSWFEQATLATSSSQIGSVSQQGTWSVLATPNGLAATSLPTSVSNGVGVTMMLDKFGRVIVAPQGDRALATRVALTISGTTTETNFIAQGGSGVFWDLTHLACSNTAPSTATRIDIRATPGGTPVISMWLAANGGGFVMPFLVPLVQTNSNATWTAQTSVVATDVRCSAIAVQNK